MVLETRLDYRLVAVPGSLAWLGSFFNNTVHRKVIFFVVASTLNPSPPAPLSGPATKIFFVAFLTKHIFSALQKQIFGTNAFILELHLTGNIV